MYSHLLLDMTRRRMSSQNVVLFYPFNIITVYCLLNVFYIFLRIEFIESPAISTERAIHNMRIILLISASTNTNMKK